MHEKAKEQAVKNTMTISEATKADVLPALEILLDSYLGEEYFSRERLPNPS
jgi:hypothetical protein